jgi:hypothetical protein
MTAFRLLLVLQILLVSIYTVVVGSAHGWDLLSIFFGNIIQFSWAGQFNFDFLMMLTLSALWTAWRNNFSPLGLGLGVVALVGGILFLAPYLLFLSFQEKGNMKSVVLGRN